MECPALFNRFESSPIMRMPLPSSRVTLLRLGDLTAVSPSDGTSHREWCRRIKGRADEFLMVP